MSCTNVCSCARVSYSLSPVPSPVPSPLLLLQVGRARSDEERTLKSMRKQVSHEMKTLRADLDERRALAAKLEEAKARRDKEEDRINRKKSNSMGTSTCMGGRKSNTNTPRVNDDDNTLIMRAASKRGGAGGVFGGGLSDDEDMAAEVERLARLKLAYVSQLSQIKLRSTLCLSIIYQGEDACSSVLT